MKPIDHAINTLEHNLENHSPCSESHCTCINMRVALCNLRDRKEKNDYRLETIEELLVGIYQ